MQQLNNNLIITFRRKGHKHNLLLYIMDPEGNLWSSPKNDLSLPFFIVTITIIIFPAVCNASNDARFDAKQRMYFNFPRSSNMYFILQRWKIFLTVINLLIQTVHCDYMPWSFFSENGTLDNIKIKWKDSIQSCPSFGLEVIFEVNQQSVIDYVCLVPRGTCYYSGSFLSIEATEVVVSKGCPDENPDVIEVTFQSDLIHGFNFMSNQLLDGLTVDPLRATFDTFSDVVIKPVTRTSLNLTRSSTATFSANGYEMDVVIFYDDNFRNNKHSGSDSAAKSNIEAIMGHVQTYFNLDSLGTKIKINTKRIEYVSGKSWTASLANLQDVESYVNGLSGDGDIDAFIVVSFENNVAGTTGIAWLGTTCNSAKGDRTNINEWFGSDINTAQTIAHELGHNLGMNHDFNEDSNGAKLDTPVKTCTIESAPNNVCTNLNGGIMDYYQTTTDRWSCCSREDLLTYFRGKQMTNSWCLAEQAAIVTTTPTTTTTTTTTTTAPEELSGFEAALEQAVQTMFDIVDALTGPLGAAFAQFLASFLGQSKRK